MSESLADAFDRVAGAADSRVAVHEDGREWAFGELRDRSEAVSRLLAPLCPEPGQRVGLMVPNSAAYVAAFYGIVRIGGVVAPLNPRYGSQELAFYLTDARAVALVVSPESSASALAVLAELDPSPALIEIDHDGTCRLVRDGSARERAIEPATDPEGSPLLHQYTSGSTGTPKRVVRTHENLHFELERLARIFELDEGDRFVGAAPFSHVNGLVRTMLSSMFVGATLYPVRTFERRELLSLITSEKLTFFGGVPQMFALLAATSSRDAVDLSTLRVVFSSSAPLLEDDNHRFHERYGTWVSQLYGSTETGTISVNLEHAAELPRSVGQPLPGVRLAVLDEQRGPLSPDREGEVAVASPAAIRRYDGNAEASAASFGGGFYFTGDLGRLDADGNLTLTGRTKLMINRGGFKVNPLEVERAIQDHSRVRDVVVLGAPGIHGDEIVRCIIVVSGPCTAEEIVRWCTGRIADYKIPSRIEFRDALPRSETGKLLRHEL